MKQREINSLLSVRGYYCLLVFIYSLRYYQRPIGITRLCQPSGSVVTRSVFLIPASSWHLSPWCPTQRRGSGLKCVLHQWARPVLFIFKPAQNTIFYLHGEKEILELSTWQRCIINYQSLLKWKMHLMFTECKISSGNGTS